MPSERAKSAPGVDYRVLNFFRDDEDSCALTAQVNNVRFHIIADAGKIRKGTCGQHYSKLLDAVKGAEVDEAADGTDSGVDVSNGGDGKESDTGDDPEEQLHRWMLAPLTPRLEELAPAKKAKEITLKYWYDGPVHFFKLEIKNNELVATELEADEDREKRISELVPEMAIPKYIQQLDVPRISASDLTVIGGHDYPPPYHPARVRAKDGKISFLKLAGGEQGEQATKRELKMLSQVEKKGLHDKIRCPKLEALVLYGDDKTQIMGFLQTDIPNPVPLTHHFDPETDKKCRDRWTKETERIIEVLHAAGIVWGDAKADNFMVDEKDELWIIDFGGSYTPGWVDPKVKETEEGDDQGVEKISNALSDPVANVWDPDAEERVGGKRRKAGDEDGGEDRPPRKQRKGIAQEKTYCYCDQPSSGRMVGCDGEGCERGWFHFECVGLKAAPGSEQEWVCEDCRAAVQ
ncbi:hypothetical protein EJ03DRAFT_170651 [Teratosphaeria nubilosa]|uniref:PHD-type domain-containing protein n=1 Tax=Teratosphaeria nubilosa TaxID=161662 RepID=A0A6G1LK42_9PEZI|nr:hypothetical protein EJ03DRAFT_170651 [Teratosphaeria nubilosa]